jgi:hypothetical protein
MPHNHLQYFNVCSHNPHETVFIVHSLQTQDFLANNLLEIHGMFVRTRPDERGADTFTNNAQSITASPVSRCNAAAWKSYCRPISHRKVQS